MLKNKKIIIFSSSEDIEKHFSNKYQITRISDINDLQFEKMRDVDLFVIDIRNGEKIHLIDLIQLTYANQWCPVAIYEPKKDSDEMSLENKTLHFIQEDDTDKKIQEKTEKIIDNNDPPPSLKDITKMLFLDRIDRNKPKRKKIYA